MHLMHLAPVGRPRAKTTSSRPVDAVDDLQRAARVSVISTNKADSRCRRYRAQSKVPFVKVKTRGLVSRYGV